MVTQARSLPIYLFFGDEFLVKEQVESLVSRVLDIGLRATNLIVLNGPESDAGTLLSLVKTPSLFGDARVILVEDSTLFSGRKDNAKLLDRMADAARSQDSRAVMRYMGQLMHTAGVVASDVFSGEDWLTAVSSQSLKPEIKEILLKAALEWAHSEKAQEPSGIDDVLEDLLQSNCPEGTHLIFTALVVDKKKRSFKRLQEAGGVVTECNPVQEKFGPGLDRSYFQERVRSALAVLGKKISGDAMAKMYALTGTNIRRLQSELSKLVSYVGDRTKIELPDVEALFEDFHEAAFFELSTAMRTGDVITCLKALHQNMKIVAHPLQTLAIMANEVRRLLIAKDLRRTLPASVWKPGMPYAKFKVLLDETLKADHKGEIKEKIKQSGMKPYTLHMCLEAAERFSDADLVDVMEALLEADILLKSSRLGRLGAQSLFETILLKICPPGSSRSSADRPR
jgi:DNA polymerase III subunit delta